MTTSKELPEEVKATDPKPATGKAATGTPATGATLSVDDAVGAAMSGKVAALPVRVQPGKVQTPALGKGASLSGTSATHNSGWWGDSDDGGYYGGGYYTGIGHSGVRFKADAHIDHYGGVTLTEDTTLTKAQVKKALGPHGVALCTILGHTRASGAESHTWVNDYLLPELKKLQGSAVFQDNEHNVFTSVPGDDATLFTAHTDTVHRQAQSTMDVVQRIAFDANARMLFKDDGECLGADDGTGIYILMRMLKARIPGRYCFFADEEIGGIGSKAYVNRLTETHNMAFAGINRVISFDRKGSGDVITRQRGGDCCSQAFAKALADQLTEHSSIKHWPDPTGSFTDSASFADCVPECTNLSVGYKLQHGGREHQCLATLEKNLEAFTRVNWRDLPTRRDPYAKTSVVANPKPPASTLFDASKHGSKARRGAPASGAGSTKHSQKAMSDQLRMFESADALGLLEEIMSPCDDVMDLRDFIVSHPTLTARLLLEMNIDMDTLTDAADFAGLEATSILYEEYGDAK